ncbi:hypothetical protein [Micromonospora sp. MH99]|uniref:hypothetical protein n=1 Tax=Micromonospora sp. MH99 TaxID=1945510 RepID=UPI001F242037|nr:hypothetical protein [Micromonospora sp. MH99]MCF0091806.1 hypothetical protein [Micromonospora sp. MH99]
MTLQAFQGEASSIEGLIEAACILPSHLDPILVLDFSVSNPFHVRPELLYHAGHVLGSLLATGRIAHAVVLLPISKKPTSGTPDIGNQELEILSSMQRWREGHRIMGSLVVMGADAVQWRLSETGGFASRTKNPTPDEYYDRLQDLTESVEERLKRKALRRMGHFQFGTNSDAHCTRYFFDASLAVDEVADLVVEFIRQQRLADSLTVVYSHQSRSPWLTEAGWIIAGRLGKIHKPLPPGPDVSPGNVVAGTGVLLLDLVSTGETAKDLISALSRHGAMLHPTVISVFGGKDQRLYVEDLQLVARSLHRVNRELSPRSTCPQCRAKLGFTHPHVEGAVGLRAYDFWTMLLLHDWVEEKYGPENAERIRLVPDFEHIFEEFGDWIAYKIDKLIKYHLGAMPEEVVFVSPDEPGMRALTQVLKRWLGDRPVSVAVPRPALNGAERSEKDSRDAAPLAEDALTKPREPSDTAKWRGQLSALSKDAAVYMLDEFNGSGTTAHAMRRLLAEVGVEAKAYVPFLNRDPDFTLPEVPVLPLYEIPRPRRFS